MGFNQVVTAPQQAVIDAGGYQGRDYACFTPMEIVFRARPAVTAAADVTFSFLYDTVTVGAYTDVKRDMTVLITFGTALNDLKRPLWRGRISTIPSATILYISEASIALSPALYITVINSYEPVQRLRSMNLIDGYLPFEKLAPAIKGLQSSYFQEPVAGEGTFAFSPIGQAMEEGSTITDATAWTWDIPGFVYTGGTSSTDREIEGTLPTGHVWATVECEDSNGVIGSFIFEIYVQDRYDSDLIYLGNEGADITNDWSSGVNASINYFSGVEDILDRTRCTIVTFEKGRGGDAEFPNISFVGYLRNDDNQTTGDEQYSLLKSRSYQISGFAALMGESKLSQLAVTDTAVPTLWDQMKYPNAARVISHLTNRYSTLARLCCIDFGDINDNAWYGGDMDIESAFLLDACNQTAEEINAQLIFCADGQIGLHRNLNFLDDTARNAADIVATIPTSRMTVVNYTHPHLPNLAQLQVGFRSYRTADGSSIGLTATAPAIALNEGADFDEAPNQLLTADASVTDAKTEARARAGNLLAYRDDSDEFTVELDGVYRFAQPSQHQWWELDIDATILLSALPENSNRFLLKSISHKFEPERGTRQLTGTFKRETVGGLAMILVEVIPDVVPTVMPPRPPMSAYQGAFAPAGTLNYTSQTPDRVPPGSYAYVSMPSSPQQQAEAQQASQPGLGCRVQTPAIKFRNPSDVMTGFSTLLGGQYYLGVKGFAKIADNAWQHSFNLVQNAGTDYFTAGAGVWTAGVGYDHTDLTQPTVATRTVFLSMLTPPAGVYTRISFTYNLTKGTYTSVQPTVIIFINGAIVTSIASNVAADGSNLSINWTGSVTNPTSIFVQVLSSYDGVAPYTSFDGSCRIMNVTFGGSGANPFTGDPGGELMGDAFWQWMVIDGEDGEAELYPDSRGLRINSTAVGIPPDHNANHAYTIEYTGIGSPVGLRFQDDDYSDNEAKTLYAIWCGENAGT